jgi:hypothetical protein
MLAYNKDLEGAYGIAKETIDFKSNNIGSDISETILAMFIQNSNVITAEVLEKSLTLLGNNLTKIMAIYLNNQVNNIDKFILSLCLISKLNKLETKTSNVRRLKTEASTDSGDNTDDLVSSGKFI